LKASAKGKHVKLTTLEEIVKRFNLKDAVLKMDCEGCEYTLLNAPIKSLRAFHEIIMEYHYGCKDLKEKLEKAGFNVKTEPTIVNNAEKPILLGYLYGKRI